MHHRAKFHANRSNCCGDMAIILFSRWRPYAMLDFQKFKIVTAGTVRRVSVHILAKFGADWLRRYGHLSVFKDGCCPPS